MALEDIVKGFERFETVAQTEATLVEDPHSPEARNNFGAYMHKYQIIPGISEADAQLMGQNLDIDAMRRQLAELKGAARVNLADIARDNHNDVLDTLPQDTLLEYAMGLGKVPITRNGLQQIQKKEDFDNLRGVLLNKYVSEKDGKKKTNPYWAEFISLVKDPNVLLTLGTLYADEERNKFIAKNAGRKEKGEKGKEKYVVEADKLKAYITDKIGKLKDSDRLGEYVQLAALYRQHKQSKK